MITKVVPQTHPQLYNRKRGPKERNPRDFPQTEQKCTTINDYNKDRLTEIDHRANKRNKHMQSSIMIATKT